MEKVLVTGAAGYIGSVLVRKLLKEGYFVRGMDILYFGGHSLTGLHDCREFELLKGDVRKPADLKAAIDGIDHVIHLAAIVGDPACSKQPALAREINWHASRNLFDMCHASKTVKRFIFASTCSNYGRMTQQGYVNEESELRPVSLYAELKVRFEQYLLQSKARKDFTPTSIRFATAFGLSPRMRFDLTVNEFVKEAFLKKQLIIYGEQFWRPYCHVDDLSLMCISVLKSGSEKVDHQVFGAGDTKENYQKKMLAEEISKVIPEVQIKYVHKEEDPRDYRVDFSKIKKLLGYNITKTVADGIKEIQSSLKKGIFSDPEADCYRNA